jgi:hypothetical protein
MIQAHFTKREDDQPGRACVIWVETDAEAEQVAILAAAAEKYGERNLLYNDNWKRMGWRGMLIRVRERAERVWDALWDGGTDTLHDASQDDALDMINFAAFLIRAIREGNRDGSWFDSVR